MISLEKTDKPEILLLNEAEWTAQYIALKSAGGSDPTTESRHRHPDIKARLIEETFDKCAYCEQKLRSSQFGDVEHIRSKSQHPELYVSWDNLTLGCKICNTYKSNRDGFINPYVDNPSDYLIFVGPMISHLPGNEIGRQTERGLRLNRIELVNKRTEKLSQLQDNLDLYEKIPNGVVKDILKEEIKEFVGRDREFSAFSKQYLTDIGYDFFLHD